MSKALEDAQGPVLAFCRSGTRSIFLWALARAQLGDAGEELEHVPAFLVSFIYLISNFAALVTLAVAAISYLSSMVPAMKPGVYLLESRSAAKGERWEEPKVARWRSAR